MNKNAIESTDATDRGEQPSPVPCLSGEKDEERFIKRQGVADLLGVTVSEVRRLERTGQLRPEKRNSRGVWLFDAEEIRERAGTRKTLKRLTGKSNDPYTPEQAATVFKALNEGKTMIECVIECLIMPEVVEAIAAVHARMNGRMYLSKATLDTINALPLEGTFPLQNEAALLEVLQGAASDSCKSCGNRSKVYCKPCAFKLGQKAMRDPLT